METVYQNMATKFEKCMPISNLNAKFGENIRTSFRKWRCSFQRLSQWRIDKPRSHFRNRFFSNQKLPLNIISIGWWFSASIRGQFKLEFVPGRPIAGQLSQRMRKRLWLMRDVTRQFLLEDSLINLSFKKID